MHLMKAVEYFEHKEHFERLEEERRKKAKSERNRRLKERRKQRAENVDAKGFKIAVAGRYFEENDKHDVPASYEVRQHEERRALDTSLDTSPQDAWINNRASDKAPHRIDEESTEPIRTFDDEDDLGMEPDGYIPDDGFGGDIDDVPEDVKDQLGDPDNDEDDK